MDTIEVQEEKEKQNYIAVDISKPRNSNGPHVPGVTEAEEPKTFVPIATL